MKRIRMLIGVAALFGGSSAVRSEPSPSLPAEAHVSLVSGKVLLGRVTGSETIQGNRLLQVTTDFGQILVPAKEVKEKVEPKVDPEATFFAGQIRVVRIQGKIERQAAKDGAWFPVKWTDAYDKEIVNLPNAIVKPGDRIRAGPDGELDLQPHKDVWIRITPNSEIDLPAARGAPGTLSLLKGRTVQEIAGRPRGETFRIQTPSALLGVKGTLFGCEVGGSESVRVAEGSVGLVGGLTVPAGHDAVRGSDGVWTLTETPARGGWTFERDVPRLPVDWMTLVPAGKYRVGGLGQRRDLPTDRGCSEEFVVTQAAFLLDRFEVTRGAMSAFRFHRTSQRPVERYATYDPSRQVAANDLRRVEEALAFARWCGKSITTEAQWEIAARGPGASIWPWGNDILPIHRALPFTWGSDVRVLPSGPPVDAPTVDISGWGAHGMVSHPAELCSTAYYDDIFFPREEGRCPMVKRPGVETSVCVRGLDGSTRLRFGALLSAARSFGFRCVVELE